MKTKPTKLTRRFLNTMEVAEYLCCAEETVRNMRKAGLLPSFRLCNAFRYRIEDIEAYINNQLEESMKGAANE